LGDPTDIFGGLDRGRFDHDAAVRLSPAGFYQRIDELLDDGVCLFELRLGRLLLNSPDGAGRDEFLHQVGDLLGGGCARVLERAIHNRPPPSNQSRRCVRRLGGVLRCQRSGSTTNT